MLSLPTSAVAGSARAGVSRTSDILEGPFEGTCVPNSLEEQEDTEVGSSSWVLRLECVSSEGDAPGIAELTLLDEWAVPLAETLVGREGLELSFVNGEDSAFAFWRSYEFSLRDSDGSGLLWSGPSEQCSSDAIEQGICRVIGAGSRDASAFPTLMLEEDGCGTRAAADVESPTSDRGQPRTVRRLAVVLDGNEDLKIHDGRSDTVAIGAVSFEAYVGSAFVLEDDGSNPFVASSVVVVRDSATLDPKG